MKWLIRALVLIGVLAVPAVGLAAHDQANKNVTLPKGETHQGTYYAAGNTVTVDGDVDGDVVCAGQNVTINGTVNGDVICGGQNITINGPVSGSVRVAGQSVNVNNTVSRNVTVLGQSVTLAGAAAVSGEVAVAGQTVAVNGPVSQTVYAAGQSVALNSTVGGNVTARTNDLSLGAGASVAGNLTYVSFKDMPVSKNQVHGTISHNVPPQRPRVNGGAVAAAWIGGFVYWALASLAAALLAVWLLPRFVRAITDMMLRRPGGTVGWGALALFLGPAVLLVAAITVVGAPVALFTGMLWVLAIAATGALAGIAGGRLLLRHRETNRRNLALAALVGVPVLELIMWIPWLGWLVGLAAAMWTLGGILLSVNRARVLA